MPEELEPSTSYTMRELQLLGRDNPSWQLQLRLNLTPDLTYGDFADLVEEALDVIADRMSSNPQHHQGRSEDQLSTDIVVQLQAMGFDASHDTEVGGHCDLVVKARGRLSWLGEAKIHRDYDWLLKGYNQLTTRYANGLATNSRGGIVIYLYGKRIDLVMERWREHLGENVREATFHADRRPAAFVSEAPHENTGQPYRVRHIGICLNFSPMDRG